MFLKKISIIVPVYNMEKYLERCLESLIKQDFKENEYEIIIVNDGSIDNSKNIIKGYCENHTNIRLIEQKNAGVSIARNVGLKYAQSEYVWFVDSDDWIAANCLRSLVAVLDENNLDMFCVGPSIPYKDNFKDDYDKEKSLSKIFSGRNWLLDGGYPIGIWSYIYKKSFLDEYDLKNKNGVYCQDEEFTPRAIYYATRIMLLNNFSVYSYFIREGSITMSISEKHVFDKLEIAASLKSFSELQVDISDIGVQNFFLKKSYHLFMSGLNSMLKLVDNHDMYLEYINRAKRHELYPVKYSGDDIKERLLIVIINMAPYYYFNLKKCLKVILLDNKSVTSAGII